MNSFNHYAYGSVCDWIYGQAVGITVTDEGAGYESFTLTPHPCKELGFVNCTLNLGLISILNDSSVCRLILLRLDLSSLSIFSFQSTFVGSLLLGGLKWNRTIDLALIRRAL